MNTWRACITFRNFWTPCFIETKQNLTFKFWLICLRYEDIRNSPEATSQLLQLSTWSSSVARLFLSTISRMFGLTNCKQKHTKSKSWWNNVVPPLTLDYKWYKCRICVTTWAITTAYNLLTFCFKSLGFKLMEYVQDSLIVLSFLDAN